MTTQEFLSHLEKVRPIRGGWMARCPAHEDRSPSLSITEGEGKTLLHCHAGCAPEAIAKAMGLSMTDLFSDSPVKENTTRRQGTTPATIEALARIKKLPVDFLRDEMGLRNQSNGVLVPYFQPDASLAPRQRIRHTLEHSGKWCTWSTGSGDVLPYGLELLSPAQDQAIIIVEGESDPDVFIPKLVELHRKGLFPFDRMVRFYSFDQINEAVHDSEIGKAIKPIIRIS